jgi:hypothetical protein
MSHEHRITRIDTMLKTIASLALLSLATQASAYIDTVIPIERPQDCPGLGAVPVHAVIPHVTTEPDDLGDPWQLTLTFKDWRPRSTETTWLKICAMTPNGDVIGGSTLTYTFGSRLTLHRSDGTNGVGLDQIVGGKTGGVGNRVFQQYIAYGLSNNGSSPQIEFGQSGNGEQYLISAPVPKPVDPFYALHDSVVAPFDSTYYVANATSATYCDLTVAYLDEDGLELAATSVPMPAFGSVTVSPDAYKRPGAHRAVVLRREVGCPDLYVMRVTEYPSGAIGGRTAVLTTSR